MSALAQFKTERGLSHILRDLAVARRALRNLDAARAEGEDFYFRDLESAALDQIDELRNEARLMIQAMTGCPWAAIEEANL